MYTQIVVGTDGSTQALEAVRAAGRLAALCGASSVHVVTACHIFSPQEMARIRADLPEEFHEVVNPHLDANDRFKKAEAAIGSGLTMIPHERNGDPADAILGVAESVNADLIVVGARGMGNIERFIRGSVSTKVAQHSPCDVLVVEHAN